MNKSLHSHSEEPFWATPENISERLQSRQQNSEYTAFILCGVYCAIAIFFLMVFGFAALMREEFIYAYVIFAFAASTALIYGCIWVSGHYFLSDHLIAILMGSLCVYLFYTGGTDATGPIFYLVFPMVAVLLKGFAVGTVYIVLLAFISVIIYTASLWGFDREMYESVFITRIAAAYTITSFLAAFYSYFKYLSERELLITYEDLEQLTLADQSTGLANRRLIEKLLNSEYKRYSRYGFKFSLMLISINSYSRVIQQYGQEVADLMFNDVADIIQFELREPDIVALWEKEIFFLLLPNTGKESSKLVAERICQKIADHEFFVGSKIEKAVASVGLSEVSEDNLKSIIQKLELKHYQATKQPNSSVVSE